MEIRNFYRENENLIKKGVISVGGAVGAFFAGFLIYYWKYRKQLKSGENIEKKPEAKIIPVEKLEKMVNKIKNGIIHNMTLMHDLSHKYDPEEFAKKDEDDIMIEEVKVEDEPKGGESLELLKSESLTGENANLPKQASQISSSTKKSDSRIDTFKREYKPLVDKPKFRDERLLNFELTKIKQFEVEPDEYYGALKKNMDNEKIKKNIKIIADFKKHFDRDELMKIDFGEAMNKNYLKIITNIYYINLRKSQKKFKNDFVDKGYDFKDANETANAFNDIYKSFLKDTRQEVLSFFGVTGSEIISPKVMLRIYPFYFSPYHSLRMQYEKINQDVNMLIKKIQLLGSIDELYDDNHPDAILKPADKMIDFTHLLTQKAVSSYKRVNPVVDSLGEAHDQQQNRSQRILNKFEEVYEKKEDDLD